MKSLIQKLTETFSPSGYESAIREVVRAEIEPLADEIRVDALGNLIARKGAGGKKIMLAAHMDEIGLIVTHVDKNGFVRFTSIGTFRPHTLVGARVRFLNGAYGLVGAEYITEPKKLIPLDKMFIDVGASNPKDCPVKIGDVAAMERPFHDIGHRMIAKSMDDRIGVAVLIETMHQLKSTPHEIYFVFSTQEEVGVRGATTSAFGIQPDLGLAIDVTSSGDTPESPTKNADLGKGPVIKIKDPGMVADPRLVDWITRTAKKTRIPHQHEVDTIGSTDARAIQISRSGVPAGAISIPCRYVHSPSEMIDYEDVQNTVKLLVALLSKEIKLGS